MPLPKYNDLSYAHFVTTKAFSNHKIFKDDKCCQILLENIKFYQKKFGFDLIAWVIMPNHLHLIIWWDVGQRPKLTISRIMQSIKGNSARQMIDYLNAMGRREPQLSPDRFEQRLKSTHRRGLKYKIWQPSFYDFNIYSDYKLEEKINYIHQNPIHAGLIESAEQYKYSSFNQYYL